MDKSSREMSRLISEMQAPANRVITHCRLQGVDPLIYCTYRSLPDQARLYRQGRTYPQILTKIDELKSLGFAWLASIIKEVGPQSGPVVTNAAPGESAHNYGEAFDATPLVHGKPVWIYEGNERLFEIFGNALESEGLFWSGRWPNFREYFHGQFQPDPNPLITLSAEGYSPEIIEEILKERGENYGAN